MTELVQMKACEIKNTKTKKVVGLVVFGEEDWLEHDEVTTKVTNGKLQLQLPTIPLGISISKIKSLYEEHVKEEA